MDFELSEKDRLLRDAVRDFAEGELREGVAERDKQGVLSPEVVKKLAAMGLMGIVFPEEYGGSGFDYIGYVTAVEELARVDASTAITVLAHTLCANHIFSHANEAQKKEFLTPLATGEKLGAWALTEPGGGSDVASMRTVAAPASEGQGDGWTIRGEKTFITNGTNADVMVVMAKTDVNAGVKGISAFVTDTAAPELVRSKRLEKLGYKASDTALITFDDFKVGKDSMMGTAESGFAQAMDVLDAGRIGISAMALGIARACLEDSLKYAKEREQFGKTISEFQAIQWMLSDMATEIDASRLLTYQAARLKDAGAAYTKEASMAKLFSSRCVMNAATKAVQIHGGYGYTKEYNVERYFREAKLCEIGEGTSEIQRMVIAKEVLK